ncbi:sulfite exporter TauE/SafE family protein [Calderihabitans maritimus]|nr:sulfite exporter TauE/SafE family protein [Calderihabitans maritimus]
MDWGLVAGAMLVGLVAQIVDGALGMAYGVISNSFLLSLGISPAVSSASVHLAEVFTTLTSGLSHLKVGNVDKKLLRRLALPGVLGGILGAVVLTVVPGKIIRPMIAAYLVIMGLLILNRVRRRQISWRDTSSAKGWTAALAGAGGFLDAVGGGGWGPIVTSTLLGRGYNPRKVIGSVNLAEFFVTLVQSGTFLLLLKSLRWELILGLVLGGVLAAPMAALACRRMQPRILMAVIGTVLLVLNIRIFL